MTATFTHVPALLTLLALAACYGYRPRMCTVIGITVLLSATAVLDAQHDKWIDDEDYYNRPIA